MSTLSNRPLYQRDIPHSIQEKLGLLSVFEKLITNLEEQLRSMRGEHAKLKVDVEPYRIQDEPEATSVIVPSIPKASKCPIFLCPNEILYLIFQQCLISRHREIGKLLFVCKRWNSVVINSPGLWATIEISDPREFFQDSKRSEALSYISACNTRSRDMLLDVNLDLGTAPHHSGVIAAQLEDFVGQIVEKEDKRGIIQDINSNDWNYKARNYDQLFRQFTDCVFGVDGTQLRRWASLSLIMPYEVGSAMNIWKRMSSPFSNLKILYIEQVPPEVFPSHGFASLKIPSVQRLTARMDFGSIPLSVFQLSQDILTHLILDIDERLQNIPEISLFTSLQTLELYGNEDYFDEDEDDDWTPPDPSTWPIHSIRLPYLTKLILHGTYDPLEAVQFDLPSLDLLEIYSEKEFHKLPRLSSPRVHWHIRPGLAGEWRAFMVDAALKNFVELSITAITIPEFIRAVGLSGGSLTRLRRKLNSGKQESLVERITPMRIFVENTDGLIWELWDTETKELLTYAMIS